MEFTNKNKKTTENSPQVDNLTRGAEVKSLGAGWVIIQGSVLTGFNIDEFARDG